MEILYTLLSSVVYFAVSMSVLMELAFPPPYPYSVIVVMQKIVPITFNFLRIHQQLNQDDLINGWSCSQ